MRNRKSRHHIIAKGEGGTNHRHNLNRIPDTLHKAIHQLFGNLLPHEQILVILELSETALQKKFVNELEAFLKDKTMLEMYKTKCATAKILKGRED